MNKTKKISLLGCLSVVALTSLVLSGCNNSQKESYCKDITLTPISEVVDLHTEDQNAYLEMEGDATAVETIPSSIKNKKDTPNSIEFKWNISTEEKVDKLYLEIAEDAKITEEVWKYEIIVPSSDQRLKQSGVTQDSSSTNVNEKFDFDFSKNVTNFKVGTNYYWRARFVNEEGKEFKSEPSTFFTKDTPARFVTVGGMHNFRDIGGWKTDSGKRVKQGMVYRSAAFNSQDKGPDVDPYEKKSDGSYRYININDEGIDTFSNQLHIKTDVDLRGYTTFDYLTNVNESPKEISGLKAEIGLKQLFQDHGYNDYKYELIPVTTAHELQAYGYYGTIAVNKFFKLLTDENNYPIDFHCQQGKDRTGFIAYLLEGFLGCNKADMIKDYMLSNFGGESVSVKGNLRDRNYDWIELFDGQTRNILTRVYNADGTPKYEAEKSSAGVDVPVFEQKDVTLEGSTISERIENYLITECLMTKAELDKIKDILIEK